MKKFIFVILGLAFLLQLNGCKKDSPTPINGKPPKSAYFKSIPNDTLLGNRIKTMMVGLLDISKDSNFVTIVNSEVSKQFDDDDNVLLSTLTSVCTSYSIDLVDAMDQSISAYDDDLPNAEHDYDYYNNLTGQTEIEDIIDGFEWEGNFYYLQIYIPNSGLVNLLDTPVICFGHQEVDTTIGYKINADNSISTFIVDEEFAENNLVWIVSVNESVGDDGLLAKPLQEGSHTNSDGYAKSLGRSVQVSAVKISDIKESWIKGKAEVTIAAGVLYSYCGWKKVLTLSYLVKVSRDELNTWCSVRNNAPSSSRVFADGYPTGDPLSDSERVSFVMFEKDASGHKTFTPIPCSGSGILPINYYSLNADYFTKTLDASWFPNTSNLTSKESTAGSEGLKFLARIWN